MRSSMNHLLQNFPYSLNKQASDVIEEDHSFRVKFILVVSAGGLVGLVGNGLLLCFYGNRVTRTYRSRDAIYIRRMAYTDFFICALVIPYSVFFEAGLVTNEVTCKTMEFVRHFLIYMSHLLLYTYAWELPQRHMYSESVTFNVNTSLYCILMSLLGAAPTIFIFRVAQGAHHEHSPTPMSPSHTLTNSTSMGHRSADHDIRPACHLITTIIPRVQDYDVKSLTWVYVIIPIVVYSLSLYWYLINLAAYLNSVDYSTRKDSLFLTNLEDIWFFQKRFSSAPVSPSGSRSTAAAPIASGGGKRKKRKTAARVLVALPEEGEEEEWVGEVAEDADDIKTGEEREEEDPENFICSAVDPPGFDACNEDSQNRPSILIYGGRDRSEQSLENNANGGGGGGGGATSDHRKSKKARFKAKIAVVGLNPSGRSKIRQRRGTGIVPHLGDNVSDITISSESSYGDEQDKAQLPDNTKIQIVEFTPPRRRPKAPRPILSHKAEENRIYPRVGSYKKTMATIILCDLVLIPLVLASFLVSGGNSALLNIAHLKSIVSFYVLSVLNPHLRRSVWGEKCVCFPPASDQPKRSQQSSTARPSVLQVSFVRERFRKKQAVRKLRQLRRQAHSLDGTEIL